MNLVTRIEDWGNTHRPGWLDFFRIALGMFITYKGAMFASNLETLKMSVDGINMRYTGVALAHYIVFAHLLGGPLLSFGLWTRLMSLIQLPILLGAVIFVNSKEFMSAGSKMELEVSIVVLVGLIVFMVFGAGKFSIDEKRRQEEALKPNES